MTSFLKDVSLGLVELAFPETRTAINDHYSSALRFNSMAGSSSQPFGLVNKERWRTPSAEIIWPHLLKVCVSLLRQLHNRDLRSGFCPENHWVVQTLNLPLDKPSDLEIPRRRRGPRPFEPIKDFTREDFGTKPHSSILPIQFSNEFWFRSQATMDRRYQPNKFDQLQYCERFRSSYHFRFALAFSKDF